MLPYIVFLSVYNITGNCMVYEEAKYADTVLPHLYRYLYYSLHLIHTRLYRNPHWFVPVVFHIW
jgi:hypothetical protein